MIIVAGVSFGSEQSEAEQGQETRQWPVSTPVAALLHAHDEDKRNTTPSATHLCLFFFPDPPEIDLPLPVDDVDDRLLFIAATSPLVTTLVALLALGNPTLDSFRAPLPLLSLLFSSGAVVFGVGVGCGGKRGRGKWGEQGKCKRVRLRVWHRIATHRNASQRIASSGNSTTAGAHTHRCASRVLPCNVLSLHVRR